MRRARNAPGMWIHRPIDERDRQARDGGRRPHVLLPQAHRARIAPHSPEGGTLPEPAIFRTGRRK